MSNLPLVLDHLKIVLVAVVFAIMVGLPLGVGAYLFAPFRKVILRFADVLQTIPSLALMGVIMTVLGAGKPTVVVGLVLYSLLPIVTNTYIGLESVSPGIKEAAVGMGMTKLHCLVRVELPIAFPVIFTGIRIATVTSIGSAVFATYVGGGGLGSLIHRGIRIQNMGMILYGTFALMCMAMIFDFGMGFIQKRLASRPM